MVVVRIMGGLGNQLFQYAAGRRLAAHHNVPLRLDLSWYNNHPADETPRHYELGGLKTEQRVFDRSLPAKVIRRLRNERFTHYVEDHFQFNASVLQLPRHSWLIGHFLSPAYFEDTRPQLLAEIQPAHPLSPASAQLLATIQAASESVSLHIRRGDYLTNPYAIKSHGVLPQTYYQQALRHLALKKPAVYVFSDDIEWCQQHLKLDAELHFVDHSASSIEDLMLMSACRHNIIANSSFSWWGGWLNQNPAKTVIAPKRWSPDATVDVAALLPKQWIIL